MSFDTENFLNSASTEVPEKGDPIPEGEYDGTIEKLEAATLETKNGERPVINVTFVLDDPDGKLKALTGRDKPMVRWTLWLDMRPDGKLDMGKGMNGSTRVLLTAAGIQPGQSWKWTDFNGRRFRGINVEHVINKKTNEPIAQVSSLRLS